MNNQPIYLSPGALRDLAAATAKQLEDRALVGPIQPLAVSYEAAGALLGVSGRSARNWADAGHLTRCLLGDGTPRITVASIRAYIERTTQAPAQAPEGTTP